MSVYTFVPAAPTQCSPGKLGDLEVRTCKVCAVTLYTANRGAGSWEASVRREIFDVAFKRGQSLEQPDISPATAGQGAWVSIVPPQPNQFMPPQISRTVQAVIEIDYQMAANILGLTYQKGQYGSHLFYDPSGANMYSNDVPNRLRNIPTSQLVGIVGDCPKS